MATFKPRLTKPEKGNPYYNTKSNGGYSDAIQGRPTDSGCNVLSNCVGYAYGRFNEIGEWDSCKYLYPTNAENFIQYAGGCEVGDTPRVGACMVWRGGPTLSGSDGAGHVAIVEKVISETEVITSESGYGVSVPFWTKTRKKETFNNWGAGNGYEFLGFIYNPAKCCQDDGEVEEPKENELAYNVGDIVQFVGTKCYKTSIMKSGRNCTPGVAKITVTYAKGNHQYHLVAVQNGGSNVCGWVDAADIEPYSIPSAPTAEYPESISDDIIGQYKVKPLTGLNLRTGAGTHKAKIETMQHGSIVQCNGGHTGNWYYVISKKGNIGFCLKSYLTKL